LAAIVDRQYGLVTRAQLLHIGVGKQGIVERVRSKRLRRLHRSVYAVGHALLRPEAYWLAAVLACGPGAVLSHRSAAALWELAADSATVVDVTVPTQAGRGRPRGIRVHRSGRLPPAEVTVHEGIPVTTVARTLLDFADTASRQSLKRAIDESEHRRRFDLDAIRAVVEANPGRRGARLLALAQAPAEPTRSQLEEVFLAFVERHGLPRPLVGVALGAYTADFLWPQEKLIVETDGLDVHGTRAAFEHDRRRDRRLLEMGYRTVRLTSRALDLEAAAVAAQLRAILTRSQAGANADTRSRSASKPPSRARSSSARAR
jgi:hypothetical protein